MTSPLPTRQDKIRNIRKYCNTEFKNDNIIVLDRDPIKAAQFLDDDHLREAIPYYLKVLKRVHWNSWAEIEQNKRWLWDHLIALLVEFKYRFGELHVHTEEAISLPLKDLTRKDRRVRFPRRPYGNSCFLGRCEDFASLRSARYSAGSRVFAGKQFRAFYLVPGRTWTNRKPPKWYVDCMHAMEKKLDNWSMRE